VRRLLAVALLLGSGGCVSPTAPTQEFVCSTQPRGYYNPATGVTTMEVDHYAQSTPCPAVPIR
jgi:hypothetical protein